MASCCSISSISGLSVSSHGMQELHVSLVSSQVNSGWLEAHSFYIDQYTTRPLVLEHGMAMAPDQAGMGLNLLQKNLNHMRLKYEVRGLHRRSGILD